jgi:hypothetical protein
MNNADMPKTPMKRIETVLLAILFLLCMGLLWCKVDGVQVICAEYHPTEAIEIEQLHAYPGLLPHITTREPGGLFKYRVTWHGPHTFRISFRDFGKMYEKVRVTAVELSTADGTWAKNLVIHPQFNGWRKMEKQSWTDGFNETWVYAVEKPDQDTDGFKNDIVLPSVDIIVARVEFEIQRAGQIQKISKLITLELRPKKTYGSYLMALVISE